MPTSEGKPAKRDRPGYLYYIDENGNKQDREFHEEILNEGDHDAAREVSRRVMERHGLDPDILLPRSLKKRAEIARQEALRLLERAADWDESLHPRDEGGRFGHGGGGNDSTAAGERPFEGEQAKPEAMSHRSIRQAIDKVAYEHKFDPNRVTISDGERPFTLNGKNYMAAGTADIRPPMLVTTEFGPAEESNPTPITLYAKQLTPENIEGVISHEIEHVKYQTTLNKWRDETEAVMDDPGPPPNPNGERWWEKKGGQDAVLGYDDQLRPPYDEKYPIYHAMWNAFRKPGGTAKFAESDGVSTYSYEYWKGWKDGRIDSNIAIHETLAEMARIKYVTGKFPNHMGERIMSYRGEDKPAPSKAQQAASAKLWRDLYRTVETIYRGTL